MRWRHFLSGILIFAISSSVGCTICCSPIIKYMGKEEIDVTFKFFEMVSQNKLPAFKCDGLVDNCDDFGKCKDSGEVVDSGRDKEKKEPSNLTRTYKIRESIRCKPWLNEMMLADLEGCRDLYVVYVEFNKGKRKGEKLQYFFCIEDSIITFISAYKQNDSTWVRVEE